jgi:hypothetical protein
MLTAPWLVDELSIERSRSRKRGIRQQTSAGHSNYFDPAEPSMTIMHDKEVVST